MREKKGRVLMNGKSKCKILKDIRRQIAADNDIEFVTSECKYQGECTGTCPKCEAEVRYLEQELDKRQKAGKAVAVAGLAVSFFLAGNFYSQVHSRTFYRMIQEQYWAENQEWDKIIKTADRPR